MKQLKYEIMDKGQQAKPESLKKTDFYIDDKRLATSRLIARLGLKKYDIPAPIDTNSRKVSQVRIPMQMHIGVACLPIVKQGEYVRRGALIAQPPKSALGANIHATISGVVTDITKESVEISNN